MKTSRITLALVFIACATMVGLQTGCATRGGTVAINIGTSRTSAIAGENRETDAVGIEGSGGIDASLPIAGQ